MKVADVQLGWIPSPTPLTKEVAKVSVDGAEPDTIEVVNVDSVSITVKALQSVRFWVETTDDEGLVTISKDYSFQVGDLEAPLPATGLFHKITAIRDVPDEPTV